MKAGCSVADIFVVGSGLIHANILPSGNLNVRSQIDSTETVIFELQRSGDAIIDSSNDGSGYSALNTFTDPSLTAASTLSLFLIQEEGNTAAASVDPLVRFLTLRHSC